MQEEIDLEYYVSEISNPMSGVFFAMEGYTTVGRIDGNLDSIQEALDDHGKVFLELGDFSYDEACETCLMFNGHEFMIGLTDRYYDKYKFSHGGYGIFLDSDLNVECGYCITKLLPYGHCLTETTVYNFKDAREDDVIKEKIYSLLSWTGIESSQTSNHEDYASWIDNKTNIEFLEILQNHLIWLQDKLTSLINLNNEATDIPQDEREMLEDGLMGSVASAEKLLAKIKRKLYRRSYSVDELDEINKIEREINKIEKETIQNIKQSLCSDLFKRIYAEIDKDYYSSLCKKIDDFFSLNYETNDEVLKYLCNNFPENSVYLFILHYEPDALPSDTFDKGLHEGGLLIRLKNGTILSSWNDVVKKYNVEHVIEDLSNETNLASKYEPYTNLKSVKLTGITKEVTDMSKMFYGCESLEDISGLSEWDVSNITNMNSMFYGCKSLVDVSDLGEWDVSNVTNMESMFAHWDSLVDVSDLGKWDVSNVVNMRSMFLQCSSLEDVSGLSEWDVSNVTTMWAMFIDCHSLVDISGLSEWDVSSVTNMFNMFAHCYSLVDVSALGEWNVSNVRIMNSMFNNCKSLVDVSALGEWDVSNGSDMLGMFAGCKSLVDVSALGEWNVSNVSSIQIMFQNCTSLTDISALGKWNMFNVRWISGMFADCKSLVDISSLSNWNLSRATIMNNMFANCKSLVDVSALGKWNVSNVQNMMGMFANCKSLVDVSALGEWDVSNVSNMKKMFQNCTSLTDISALGKWDISNVENMENIFRGCKSLVDDSLLKYWIDINVNKTEKEIPIIKQNFCSDLFKKVYAEIDKDYYSSLCKKIDDFFSLNYETNDEVLKYLCNNFPENSVYLFILHYEPHALPSDTFDKGLHEGGLLIRLRNGAVLSSWDDVVKKYNVEYVIEDLSNETTLSSKYESCSNLKSVKLTGIKKEVTDMSKMFYGCESLEDVSGLSNLDVSNVTNMKNMFAYCKSLVDISDLGEWDVSNVSNMEYMFMICRSLVDVSALGEWDVSNVTYITCMFMHCSSLVDVSGLGRWDVSSVTGMDYMFDGCSSLVDVSGLGEWNVSNVWSMESLFADCESLVDVSGLSEWDVSNVEKMWGMFNRCKSLVDNPLLKKLE